MPLVGTRGAASAQGFGMFASIGEKYWLGQLKGAGQTSYGRGVAIDSFKNVYLSGSNANSGQTAKYNTSGIIQSQTYVNDFLNGNNTVGVAVDSSNNVYYVNKLYNGSLGVGSISVIKYNSSGVRQWTRRFINLNSTADAKAITVDPSGNVYISGEWSIASAYYIVVIKIDSSGNTVWQQRLNSGSGDVILYPYGNIAADSSGNVYLSGISWNTAGGGLGQEILVWKIDSTGANVWQRALGGAGTHQGWGAGVDSSGNVYVVGRPDNYVAIAKYNSSGTLQWSRQLYNAGRQIQANNITVDASGNSYVYGIMRVDASTPALLNAFIAKYDTSGTIQWQRRLGTTSIIGGRETSTTIHNLALSSDGGMYVNGSSDPSAQYADNFFFAKLPSDGSKTGTYTLSGVSYTYAATSLTDSAGSFSSSTLSYSVSGNSWSQDTTNLTEATSALVSSVTTI